MGTEGMRATAMVGVRASMLGTRSIAREMAARARWARCRAATLSTPNTSDSLPAYRIEHRVGHRVITDLGLLEGACQHHTALAPFASALRLAGVTAGTVVLLETISGQVVARRAVAPAGDQVT